MTNQDLQTKLNIAEAQLSEARTEITRLQTEERATKQSADLWEQTAKLGREKMKCGHQEMWAYSHDGGKNGFCLLCRNAERDKFEGALISANAACHRRDTQIATLRAERDANKDKCLRAMRDAANAYEKLQDIKEQRDALKAQVEHGLHGRK